MENVYGILLNGEEGKEITILAMKTQVEQNAKVYECVWEVK